MARKRTSPMRNPKSRNTNSPARGLEAFILRNFLLRYKVGCNSDLDPTQDGQCRVLREGTTMHPLLLPQTMAMCILQRNVTSTASLASEQDFSCIQEFLCCLLTLT